MADAPFITSQEIVAAVVAELTAMRLPDDSGPLFNLVKPFDSTDIDRAFSELYIARQQRLCFVLPARDSFTNRTEGQKHYCAKRAGFALLICDTDRKTGQEAVFGGARNQGTLALKDAVVNALAGKQLGLRWVVIEPTDGDDITVMKDGDSDSGRKGWMQLFETAAGIRNISLSR